VTTAAPAVRRRDRIDDLVAAGVDVPADEIAVLRGALAGLLTHRPEVRGASAYAIARGGTIVRLFTAGGWVPILIPAAERCDAPAVLARLEAALDRPASPRDHPPGRGHGAACARRKHATQKESLTVSNCSDSPDGFGESDANSPSQAYDHGDPPRLKRECATHARRWLDDALFARPARQNAVETRIATGTVLAQGAGQETDDRIVRA
jgi:hypothetical protein